MVSNLFPFALSSHCPPMNRPFGENLSSSVLIFSKMILNFKSFEFQGTIAARRMERSAAFAKAVSI